MAIIAPKPFLTVRWEMAKIAPRAELPVKVGMVCNRLTYLTTFGLDSIGKVASEI